MFADPFPVRLEFVAPLLGGGAMNSPLPNGPNKKKAYENPACLCDLKVTPIHKSRMLFLHFLMRMPVCYIKIYRYVKITVKRNEHGTTTAAERTGV